MDLSEGEKRKERRRQQLIIIPQLDFHRAASAVSAGATPGWSAQSGGYETKEVEIGIDEAKKKITLEIGRLTEKTKTTQKSPRRRRRINEKGRKSSCSPTNHHSPSSRSDGQSEKFSLPNANSGALAVQGR